MSDQEAALAELLGEVNRGRVSPRTTSEPAATTDARDDDVANLLNLGNLDITSDASTAPDDVFARLLDDESGLEAELMRYADHDVVRDIMRGEASGLKDRARDVTSKLRAVELESIQDYVGESANLLQLHEQLEGCDDILATMESMLSGFKSDLGKISGEIKSLQDQSVGMSVKLRNRKAAEARLGTFVETLTVPPELIRAVVEDDVSEDYLKHLVELDRRLAHIDAAVDAKDAAAVADVQPELARLRAAAAKKARDFLMQKLYSLRKPKTNIQIIQQNVLLRFKYLVTFLRVHAPEILTEVRACYVETMSRVLRQALQGYASSLSRLQQNMPRDLLGSEEGIAGGAGGGFFGQFSGAGVGSAAATAMKNRASVFSLGSRAEVLDALETTPPLIIHQAESSGVKFPHERLFRSAHKLLMDTATFEYLFCAEFWAGDHPGVFSDLFAAPLAAMEEHLAGASASAGPASSLFGGTGTHDAVGLLLMIRVNREHRVIMSRRRVPCLDHYLDGVNLSLWPRFKAVFDAHIKSVTDATASPSGVDALWTDDVRTHYVTRRYAEFASAMLALGDGLEDGQLGSNLERARAAVVELLERLADKFAPNRKRRTVFLVNNYDCACSVLREVRAVGQNEDAAEGTSSVDGGATRKFFEEGLAAHCDAFVEEELAGRFGKLIDFTRRAEAARREDEETATTSPGDEDLNPTTGAMLMRDFAERWKGAIETMHKDVIGNFGNLHRGMDVLQRALSQLLIYYTRFCGPEGVLARMGPEGAALCKDAISNPAFIYEIKRHSTSRIS